MRFVSINNVKEGMILAKDLIGKNNELLLRANIVLAQSYIKKIKALGYTGIYVKDALSQDIMVSEVVDENLKHAAIKSIKEAFTDIRNHNKLSRKYFNNISCIIRNLVDNILSNKDALVNMIDLKVFDDYTFYHCVNVAILSLIIGMGIGYDKEKLYKLGLASVLHDIGKMFIPKEILNKKGRLTEKEFEIIKTHSKRGYSYIKDNFEIPPSSYIGILHHHEKYDGKGYPTNIKGERISKFGRIISVADVYDAFTSDRPYRKATNPSEAIEYIMGNSGISFDPDIVSIFCKKVAPYPVGTTVELSDGRIGLVVKNYQDCCTRPVIKIFKHENRDVNPYMIDLKNEQNHIDITIKDLI